MLKFPFSGGLKVDMFIGLEIGFGWFKRFAAYVVWELWKNEWRSVENYMGFFSPVKS